MNVPVKFVATSIFLQFISLLFCSTSFSQPKSVVPYIPGKTPVGFETEINGFLKHDSAEFPPAGAYLFTGSSTIRKWDHLKSDFKEITVIQRGFGGSTMKALNYYMNNIVIPYQPRVIVVYEGDNDLAGGVSPAEFVSLCDTFIKNVHLTLPKTMICFMSIKPSFARKSYLPVQDETNRQLKKLTRKRPKTSFIDIRPLMYDGTGNLRPDFFEADSLHVNGKCYSVWADFMKEKLKISR